MGLFGEMMDEACELRDEIHRLNNHLAKVGINWSSGPDEQFGGRFVCIHGLSEDEAKSLIAASKEARAQSEDASRKRGE